MLFFLTFWKFSSFDEFRFLFCQNLLSDWKAKAESWIAELLMTKSRNLFLRNYFRFQPLSMICSKMWIFQQQFKKIFYCRYYQKVDIHMFQTKALHQPFWMWWTCVSSNLMTKLVCMNRLYLGMELIQMLQISSVTIF